MKTMKIILVTTTWLLITQAANAQMTIGLRSGVSSFTVHNDLLEEESKFTMGYNIALPLDIPVSSVFSIQPELNITKKGVGFDLLEDGIEQSLKVKTTYLELPVLLKANFGKRNFKYYVFAAPSFGYALDRFASLEMEGSDKTKEDLEFEDSGEVQDQRWELSMLAGAGASLRAGIGSIVLDVRYAHGLSDSTKFENDAPDDWKKTTNRGCIISMGYVVPIGK